LWLIEGLALRKPRLSVAALHREVTKIAKEREVAAPSYASVHAIVRGLNPTLTTLAHEGAAAFRDRYNSFTCTAPKRRRGRGSRPQYARHMGHLVAIPFT
jgi:hypothetical protein